MAGEDKDRFLRKAAALLFPIRWPEPFWLVMAEALACGTPVIALRDGSVPEEIEDGVTGFICLSQQEMVAAVGRLAEIDRARCRAEAERRFSPGGMARAYERLYELLLGQASTVDQLIATPDARQRLPQTAGSRGRVLSRLRLHGRSLIAEPYAARTRSWASSPHEFDTGAARGVWREGVVRLACGFLARSFPPWFGVHEKKGRGGC